MIEKAVAGRGGVGGGFSSSEAGYCEKPHLAFGLYVRIISIPQPFTYYAATVG